MTTKKICFIVMCALLAVVIILFAVVLSRVSTLFSGGNNTPTTAPTTQPTTAPSDPSDTTSPSNTTNPTATEHDHAYEFSHTLQPTCDSYGLNVYVCTLCGHEDMPDEERIEPLGHELTKTVVPATCTEDGYTEYKCARCPYTEKQEITAATGHLLDDGTETPGTCTDDACTLFKCTAEGCDYTEKTNIQPGTSTGEHTYGEWTPTEDGRYSHICIHCGYEEITDALDDGYHIKDIDVQHMTDHRVFIVTVGTNSNPSAYTYTIYDYVMDEEMGIKYNGDEGLVISYTAGGTLQSYTMTKESSQTVTINADGTVAGG